MAFCTGSLAIIFLFVFGTAGDPEHDAVAHLPVHDGLSALGRAAVHLHGGDAGEGRHHRGVVRRIYKWLGAVKGGLAAATVLACTALAAMVGVVGATEVTMGMIALPAMLERGYEQKLACGSLLAGGTLGILIPPSVMAIVYAVVAQQSLGELLVGSIFPGLLLYAPPTSCHRS